jgi:hypothetical protein
MVMLELGGERVLVCEPDGPPFDGEQRVTDLVGDALSMRATMIAVPVSRLDPAFFDLRSGLAGMFAQKVVVYRFKLAIVGDIADHLAASSALRDWVRECNRGGAILFVPSLDDLAARLGDSTSAP